MAMISRNPVGACLLRKAISNCRYSSNITWRIAPRISGEQRPSRVLTALPRNVLILRHAESMGNQDQSVYSRTPDWKVPLSDKGRIQARQTGQRIQRLIGSVSAPVVIYVSPYSRTRQTARELRLLNPVLYTREEPRLREQDFGNFQDPFQIRQAKRERPKFGRFFFRFPNGESGADVFDRVSAFTGSFIRDMEQLGVEQARETTAILVTHGITSRLFLMKWFHWSVDDFEALHNPPNCGLLHMRRTMTGAYELVEESRKLINGPVPEDETGVGRALKLGELLKERRRRSLSSTAEERHAFDSLPESGARGL